MLSLRHRQANYVGRCILLYCQLHFIFKNRRWNCFEWSHWLEKTQQVKSWMKTRYSPSLNFLHWSIWHRNHTVSRSHCAKGPNNVSQMSQPCLYSAKLRYCGRQSLSTLHCFIIYLRKCHVVGMACWGICLSRCTRQWYSKSNRFPEFTSGTTTIRLLPLSV